MRQRWTSAFPRSRPGLSILYLVSCKWPLLLLLSAYTLQRQPEAQAGVGLSSHGKVGGCGISCLGAHSLKYPDQPKRSISVWLLGRLGVF